MRVVGEERVAPAAGRLDVTHEQHAVGKLGEEHAWLDVAFGLRRDDVERDLPEGLVGARQRHEHHVGGRGPGRHRQHDDRPQHPEEAHAARLEDDELAVGRQAAEADENAQQQRHRNGDAQCLRHERQQHPEDGRPRDAFGDQLLGVLQDRRHHQDERQQQQPQAEGDQDFPDEIAV